VTIEQRRFVVRLDDRIPVEWRTAFTATPRHLFVPDRAWRLDGGTLVAIDRRTDPQGWLDAVYSDDVIVTQLDDGDESGQGVYTSSCSRSDVVLAMLRHLDVHEGHRVLEIGTGTGWNAAILAARLGDANVISIEVDPMVARTARQNLTGAGRAVTVITGDGTHGHQAMAPYDRIEVTCSVGVIPYAWVDQTRPGGIIITPWGPPFDNNHLVRLDVRDGEANGRIVDWAAFMRLRGQRWAVTDEPDDFADIADITTTAVDPLELLGDDAQLAVGLHLGECRVAYDFAGDGSIETMWLLAADSWASVHGQTVRQAGARRLWDEALAGYRWWIEHGRPSRQRFGLTITSQRQWVWLDDPTGKHTWCLR
jgi:protein-L-isoaspartate(D-aspartate) O-methyltransferase